MNKTQRQTQRLVLTSFVVTFITARLLVLLIMSRSIPDFYFHLGGTHVHHLNYGIFLLSIVGAVLLFKPTRTHQETRWLAIAYGAGLALTFDEFGMWLHLGGSYWQRASFDAIVIIFSLLALFSFMPTLKDWTIRKYWVSAIISILLIGFIWQLSTVLNRVENNLGPKLKQLENQGPT
jgi:hypothetical protein